jgi:LPXTG-site transpeptidase (sortase) family protein
MRVSTNKKLIYSIAVIVVSGLIFGTVLARSVFYAPQDSEREPFLPAGLLQNSLRKNFNYSEVLSEVLPTTNTGTPKVQNPWYPKKLRVPSAGVDAKVQDVGITKLGNMATPNNFTDVGWFEYGTIPGDKGSAVIAGHVNDGLGLPAVFDGLKNVKVGDDVYIDTFGGKTVHFVVTDIKTYDYKAPTEEIFNENSQPILRLITCSGVWVPQTRTHDKRLVVTAVKEL